MPQYFSLYKDLTIYENLDLRAKLYGLLDRKNKIDRILEQLNLGPRKNQIAGTLSGGLKQRLSLGAALIHSPLLLLLDEPTAGVDPTSRRNFWEIINRLSVEGVTVLLSSHDMDEVERCHKIAYMAYGRLVMSGTIAEIIDHVHLKTYQVSGPNLPLLTRQLEAIPNIELVTSYYNELHVCGSDAAALEKAIKPYQMLPQYQWQPIATRLEDVFIWLVSQTKDTRYVT